MKVTAVDLSLQQHSVLSIKKKKKEVGEKHKDKIVSEPGDIAICFSMIVTEITLPR